MPKSGAWEIRTALDRQIEEGLRARYRAKLFRLNDFTQDHDAMTILVLGGGDAFRPCRKTDAAVRTAS